MNALAVLQNTPSQLATLDAFDDTISFEHFFKPVNVNTLSELFDRYSTESTEIKTLCQVVEASKYRSIGNLVSANLENPIPTGNLFNLEGGLSYLKAKFWKEAFDLTDIYEHMPQRARDEWDTQIKERTTPEFTLESVAPTLRQLLIDRDLFFAQTIDDIFRNLSGEHVTNRPEGFSKRMIMPNEGRKSENDVTSEVIGHITDLRYVLARFANRATGEKICLTTTKHIIAQCSKPNTYGQWIDIDGNSLRIKVFKRGTVHLEVNENISWRLNQVLATLYPAAIPSKFRAKKAPKAKAKEMQFNLISQQAINLIHSFKHPIRPVPGSEEWHRSNEYDTELYTFDLEKRDISKISPSLREEIETVMKACGGIPTMSHFGKPSFKFEGDFEPLREHLVLTGTIPEQKSHQFYATEEELAQEAVDECEIEAHHDCVEPSAGHGGIAKFMPNSTTCVELSSLHCKVLESKGHNVVEADFIEWAKTAPLFDRIVMNPPYSDNQAILHTTTASKLLKNKGRLVAIFPSGLRNRIELDGYSVRYSRDIEGAFKGTGTNITVMIVTIDKL